MLTEWAHLHYLVSASISFSAGLVVIYLLSIFVVFKNRSLRNRWQEFLVFLFIGLLGLGLNGLLLFGFEQISVGYAMAKIPTAVAVFLFNYSTRRFLLFDGS